MRPTCPQCKEAIWGAATSQTFNPMQLGVYVVGWCRLDVHESCFPLHVRVCLPCRIHNEGLAHVVD